MTSDETPERRLTPGRLSRVSFCPQGQKEVGMVTNVTMGALEPENQRLVKWMQSVNFGRIWVSVRNGRLVMDSPPRVLREVKIGGENGRRPESCLGDFSLKKEVLELLEHISGIGNATVCIEIKHGLPFKMTIEEVTA